MSSTSTPAARSSWCPPPNPADRGLHDGAVTDPGDDTVTEYIVDWRTDVPGKRYSGTAVLTVWVAPSSLTTAASYSLTAQLYRAP